MQFAPSHFLLQRHDFVRRAIGEQFVVRPHQLVGNGHHLAKNFAGGFSDADVIAEAFGHFALAIETDKNRHGENVQKDRKSTRLNSSHGYISYAVFCLKKKKKKTNKQKKTTKKKNTQRVVHNV